MVGDRTTRPHGRSAAPDDLDRPRADEPAQEVADHVTSGLQEIIAKGGGAVGNTGWAVLIVERSADGAIFDLSLRRVEVARCFLAITPVSEQRQWEQACAYPSLPGVRLTKPAAPPFLAVGLLPDGMALTANDPELMLELGDFERCVAWALLDS